MKRISSIEQLKKLLEGVEQLDCFVALNYGLRSSKTLLPQEDGALVIVNEIDGSSYCINSVDKIATSKKASIVREAIEKGAFYLFEYDKEG